MTVQTTMPTADEAALRRPDFRGGQPIALAEGQVFYFPKPCVVFRPRFSGGQITTRTATDLGKDFDRIVDEIAAKAKGSDEESDEEPSGPTFVDLLFRLAILMLRLNYDLTDDRLSDLLEYKVDDEGSQETWGAILDVARGQGPKPTSGTTE